jgi:putative molybdopterin biosynthesis protein
MTRKIFKTLISVDEAIRRIEDNCKIEPLGFETVFLGKSSGRILAEDIISKIDVPNFNRASMDGYAVKATDTFQASDDSPMQMRIIGVSEPGDNRNYQLRTHEAVEVGTGAPIPSGANSVVMVEYTKSIGDKLNVYRAVSPNENIMFSGADIRTGELVLRRGQTITPTDVGVLAAIGQRKIKVFRKPIVGIISTGNELVEPGKNLRGSQIFDINSYSIYQSVLENGGFSLDPVIVKDDARIIRKTLVEMINKTDILLTSGSTSAGSGDLIHDLLDEIGIPGILAHGLDVKPGKPTIIASINSKPIVGLPGYPTSALIIFQLIVAPLIRKMAGLPRFNEQTILVGRTARRIYSAKGRRELMTVQLVKSEKGLLAFPVDFGSGAISSLALADGYIDISKNQEFIEENEEVEIKLLSPKLVPADLVIIGSHCTGLDLIYQHVIKRIPDFRLKIINNGSTGGLDSIKKGQADIAGIHLLDEKTGEYNIPYIKGSTRKSANLFRGYNREQGLMIPKGNPKNISNISDILRKDVVFINRNRGSGTRILIDKWIKEISAKKKTALEKLKMEINGYDIEAKSHSAVAATISQGKADVGVGIKTAAMAYNLDFIKLADEKYDFLINRARKEKAGVKLFLDILNSQEFKLSLEKKMSGLRAISNTGKNLTNI